MTEENETEQERRMLEIVQDWQTRIERQEQDTLQLREQMTRLQQHNEQLRVDCSTLQAQNEVLRCHNAQLQLQASKETESRILCCFQLRFPCFKKNHQNGRIDSQADLINDDVANNVQNNRAVGVQH